MPSFYLWTTYAESSQTRVWRVIIIHAGVKSRQRGFFRHHHTGPDTERMLSAGGAQLLH